MLCLNSNFLKGTSMFFKILKPYLTVKAFRLVPEVKKKQDLLYIPVILRMGYR